MLLGRQMIVHQALGVIVDDIPFWVFLWKIDQGVAVVRPARLPGMIGNDLMSRTVHVHDVDAAHGIATGTLIGDKAKLGSVGRDLRVEFVPILAARQVTDLTSIRMGSHDFPIVVDVGLVNQLMR